MKTHPRFANLVWAKDQWVYLLKPVIRNSSRCRALFCRNTVKDRVFCSRCSNRKSCANDPIAYHYRRIKWKAAKRKIHFGLTRDQFKNFCEKTDYHNTVGNQLHSATIDRIDSSKGYIEGNLQILSYSDNSAKKNLDSYTPHLNGENPF